MPKISLESCVITLRRCWLHRGIIPPSSPWHLIFGNIWSLTRKAFYMPRPTRIVIYWWIYQVFLYIYLFYWSLWKLNGHVLRVDRVHGQLKIKKLSIRLKTDRHLKVIICYNDIKQFDIVFFFNATKTTTTNFVVYSNILVLYPKPWIFFWLDKNVSCHEAKLYNSVGQTNLTHMWSAKKIP